MNWHLDVEPVPAILVLPPAAASLDEAHAAIELWEHYSGKKLDPAQRLTVEMMMATDADGQWAAATTGREEPRQNGKGEEVEVVELWGLVQRAERIAHTIHDAVMLATEAQQRMLALFTHSDLRRRTKRVWQGTGQQMIELRNGATIWYRTRTGSGLRGVDDIDRLVVDEAQHADEAHLNSITPILMVNPNPQMNVMGTAGLADKSVWWWGMRRRALSPDPGAFGYVGHTAEKVYLDGDRVVQEPPDVNDRAAWYAANPALVAGRGTGEVFFAEQLQRLGPSGFAQEHLCVWAPYPGQDGGFLSFERWSELKMEKPGPMRSVCYGVAVDDRGATVASAGRLPSGDLYVDVVVERSGTDWLLDNALERWGRKHIPVRVDPSAPEGAFVRPFTEAGVGVIEVPARQYQQSCGEVLDAIRNGTIRHLGQPELDRAVRAVQRREVGKKGAWEWAAPVNGAGIAALRAVTLALSGVKARRAPRIHTLEGVSV